MRSWVKGELGWILAGHANGIRERVAWLYPEGGHGSTPPSIKQSQLDLAFAVMVMLGL